MQLQEAPEIEKWSGPAEETRASSQPQPRSHQDTFFQCTADNLELRTDCLNLMCGWTESSCPSIKDAWLKTYPSIKTRLGKKNPCFNHTEGPRHRKLSI